MVESMAESDKQEHTGAKYAPLEEEELESHPLNPMLEAAITQLTSVRDDESDSLEVLDWGCGRGRTVLALSDRGIRARGVDVDHSSVAAGAAAALRRGLDPSEVLLSMEALALLADGSFDLIYSEETLEHVRSLSDVAAEMYRVTRPGGAGLHTFPGSGRFVEPHVRMPIVHWVRSRYWQRFLVGFWLLIGVGPYAHWPELRGRSRAECREILCRYLSDKTWYRDIDDVRETFRVVGFDTSVEVSHGRWSKWIDRITPGRNGFPCGQMLLRLRKETGA